MNAYEQRIQSVVSPQSKPYRAGDEPDPKTLAQILIYGLYLKSVTEKLIEQHWLMTASEIGPENFFAAYLEVASSRELKPFEFLKATWLSWGSSELKGSNTRIRQMIGEILREVEAYPHPQYQEFVRAAVQAMNYLSEFEDGLVVMRDSMIEQRNKRLAALGPQPTWQEIRPSLDEAYLPPSLYRAFDLLDDVFQLRYELDVLMSADLETSERIFENSGLGVQTSYATILTALRRLQLTPGAHIVDLGSGYGRLGVLGGLVRPDLWFTGYEFVGHRVEVAQASASRAGISDRVRFYQQDLSQPQFEIPKADVYYMYDPFCESTYQRVLRRVHQVACQQPLTVVTNADAGVWFKKLQEPKTWQPPIRADDGSLLIFNSIRR